MDNKVYERKQEEKEYMKSVQEYYETLDIGFQIEKTHLERFRDLYVLRDRQEEKKKDG